MRYPEERFTEQEREAIITLANIACFVSGVSYEELIGKSRVRPLPDVRKMICKYAQDNIAIGLMDRESSFALSSWFFNQDHSTISHCIGQFKDLYATNKEFKRVYDALIEAIDDPNTLSQLKPSSQMYLVNKTWDIVRLDSKEKLNTKYTLMPEELKTKAVSLYLKGYSYENISVEVGTDTLLISYMVKRMGLSRNKIENLNKIRMNGYTPVSRKKNDYYGFY